MTYHDPVTATLLLRPPPASASDGCSRSDGSNAIDPPESTSSSLAMASAMASLMASSVVVPSDDASSYDRIVTKRSTTINACSDDEVDSKMSAAEQQQQSLHLLPQLISVTVPKQRDQPAGLTLMSNNGVIISAISPTSPFHANTNNFNINKLDNGDDGGGGNSVEHGRTVRSDSNEQSTSLANINFNTSTNYLQSTSLQVDDEVLLVNSHRVKNPQRAVQLIKGTRSGQLTIVASRGPRQEGSSYVLARIDSNPFVVCSGDVHDEAAGGGEKKPSLSPSSFSSASPPPPLPSTTIKYGDTVYGLQFSSLSPSSGTSTTSNVSLTRISYKSNTTGPFVNTNLKLGDVILSVDGNVVRTASDAEKMLFSRWESSTRSLLETSIHDRSSRSTSTRVVILLVYSLWDLRKRVLEKALKIDGAGKKSASKSKREDNERAAVAGQQTWHASYSYELPTKNDNDDQKEYIILRIRKTTVTFQLDFDNDGKCSCRDHYQSLLSLDSMEEQQRQSREIQNAMIRKRSDSNYNNDVDDSGSIESDGNHSTYSRDDALAALELLFQIHIVPVIDALNVTTRRQLALLAETVAATNISAEAVLATSTTLTRQVNIDGGSCDQRILGGKVEEKSTSEAIVPILTTDDTSASSDGRQSAQRRQDQQLTPSVQSELPPGQKEENLVHRLDNLVSVMAITKPKPEMWMSYVRNESNPEVSIISAHSMSRNKEGGGPPKRVPRRHSIETFSSKSPTASDIPRFIRRQIVNEGTSGPRSNRRHTVDRERNDDNSLELNPNRVVTKPPPILELTNKSPYTAHNQRRPPTKLQRKPSIMPEFNMHYVSFRSALSALSDSNDDSSGSNTTSSDSDDSISSSDSESSGDDAHSGQWERSQADRDNLRQRSRSPNTSQLIVYAPRLNEEESKKAIVKSAAAAYSLSKVHPFTRRLKMRHGEIRKFYKVLHHVEGQGSFGTVRTCVHRSTRQRYVVKSMTIDGNMKNLTLLQDEIALVQRVNHRNVVSVREVIQDRQFIHIIMEKCNGGDLFDKIVNGGVRLSEDRACTILNELLDAVAYLHDRNIVHRDLKAEHIMLLSEDINSSIKIIDFGLATIHGPSDPPLTALAGSAFTIAPEVISRSYGKSCDLWSVGVIAYFLLTSCMPFNAKSDEEIFAKIQGGKYSYPQWARWGLSEKAKDFVNRLLVVDPKRRYNAKQALGDIWIRKNLMNCSLRAATRTNLHEFELVQPPPVQASSHPTTRSRQQIVPPKPTMSPLQLSSRPFVSPVLIQNAIDLKRSNQSMSPPRNRRTQQLQQQQLRRGPERHHHTPRQWS